MLSYNHILCLISVSINASTNSIQPGENFSIGCYVFGLSVVEYLNSDIELLLRKNNSIIQTVRVLKGGSHGENDKYGWTEKFHKNNTCEIISVRFDVFSKFSSLILVFKNVYVLKNPFLTDQDVIETRLFPFSRQRNKDSYTSYYFFKKLSFIKK